MNKWMKRLSTLGLITLAVIVLELAIPIARTPINRILGHLGVKTEFVGAFVGTAEAAVADYTFDGTADDVQAQQMLDALPSTGGKLIFRGGNYNFTATVSRAIDNVAIAGSGKATYFAYNASSPLFSAGNRTGWLFQDLRTDAGFLTLSSAGDSILLNVWNNTSYIDKTTAGGSTLPTTPITNQIFLHTPTGRNILYQYDGSNWNSIQSYAALTVYVDKTDGTDDLSHGTGADSNAFKTIQYAVNVVPGSFSGDVNIYVDNETYTEDMYISNKRATGNYGFYINGSWNQLASLTATGGNIGSGGTPPQVTGNFTVAQYDNKIIKFTSGANDGIYRLLSQTTNTTLYLDGQPLSAAPAGGDSYLIYDWGTTIAGQFTADVGADLILKNIVLSGTTGNAVLTLLYGSRVNLQQSKIYGNGATYGAYNHGYLLATNSLVQCTASTVVGAATVVGANMEFTGCKFLGTGAANWWGVSTTTGVVGALNEGCEIVGFARGVRASANSGINCYAGDIKSRVHGCPTYGLEATQSSAIVSTSTTYWVFGTKMDGSGDANGGNTYADSTSYLGD